MHADVSSLDGVFDFILLPWVVGGGGGPTTYLTNCDTRCTCIYIIYYNIKVRMYRHNINLYIHNKIVVCIRLSPRPARLSVSVRRRFTTTRRTSIILILSSARDACGVRPGAR